MEDSLTQCTQDVMDPRRMGRNNSGVSADDVADVMCILHPASPAAFKLVAETAARAPQHILQNANMSRYDSSLTLSMLQEQETFKHGEGNEDDTKRQPLDLALRFSSRTVQPHFGFVFGRNMELCDIVVDGETHKRVSNVHFAIYVNESGVVMLRDMSTNGTMVDETLLKGKSPLHEKTRMITPGSVIAILSYNVDECLKFIVRMPSRDGFLQQYEDKFREHFARQIEAERRLLRAGKNLLTSELTNGRFRQQGSSVRAPIIQNQYGMHWSGGEKYNVVGQIGKGAFATVYQLATKTDGKVFAAKELAKRNLIKKGVMDHKTTNELLIMASINHPSIVRYFEHVDVANHLYIIMEFVACGDLQQHLTEYGALRESMAKQMALQVFDALNYLHGKSITHRDIKPDNILIACVEPDDFQIKLSDFGLSKVVKDKDTLLKTFCGTLLYCAPEVFPHYNAHIANQGMKRPREHAPPTKTFHSYSQAVDIWSFGAVLWFSLCHKPPFEGVADNTGRGMFDKIMMTPLDATDLTMQGVTEEAVALLVQMLNTDPAGRPSAHQCLQNEWFGNHRKSLLGAPRQPFPLSGQPTALGAIAEVNSAAELGASQEPDVNALNSQYSEVSLDDSDYHFLDPRQSKRLKASHMSYRSAQDGALESSDEKYVHVPRMILEDSGEADPSRSIAPKSQKLFGEISQSDIAALKRPENHGTSDGSSLLSSADPQASLGSQHDEQMQDSQDSQDLGDSPSLLGAEGMVRELNMDSNSSNGVSGSNAGSRSEPASPTTPASVDSDDEQPSANTVVPAKLSQQSPKSAKAPFSRQIVLETPPSFYYKANDPSTHTLEYASKASGFDFTSGQVSVPYQAPNQGPSGVENYSLMKQEPAEEELANPHRRNRSQPAYALPRYGRLVSMPGSFTDLNIELNKVCTSWGRASDNTVVYPDRSETRIPKWAFFIFFHVPGGEDLPEGEDFKDLPGLYCGINTHASAGLHVNGVHLQKSADDKLVYGRLHTGDEVEVWQAGRAAKAGLKFRVELFCGEGKDPRSESGSKFKVLKRNHHVGEAEGAKEE